MLFFVWVATPSGASAQILKSDTHPMAEKINGAYDYDYFFPFEEDDTLHLTVVQKRKTLDERYASVKREAEAIADDSLRMRYIHINDDAYINFCLRLVSDTTAEYRSLISRINPNDSLSLINYLPQRFIESHIHGNYDNDWGHDLTDYGLEYLAVMKKYITSPVVKHALLMDCAKAVLNYGKDYADIDRFWTPFCAYAGDDKAVMERWQFKVDAIKKTKSGMVAPDISFADAEGNVHHLSDFRGKIVYIDCWATWCGPCCREIPFLEKQVEAFADKSHSIVFISISLDKNRKAWLAKIAKDKPSWPQFIVDDEGDATLHKSYGINAIPRFLLINADGTIIDADAPRPSDKNFSEVIENILKFRK